MKYIFTFLSPLKGARGKSCLLLLNFIAFERAFLFRCNIFFRVKALTREKKTVIIKT